MCTSKQKLQTLPTVLGNTAIADPPKSPLWKKSIAFIGDSITHNKFEQLQDPMTAGWPGRIGPKYEMTWCNLGIGGATVLSTTSNNTTTQLQGLIAEGGTPDVIVMQGGINDAYRGAPIGELENGFAIDGFSPDTFAGSLQRLIAMAKEAFPDARIFYILFHRTPNSLSLGDLSQPLLPKGNPADYIAMAQRVLEKWDVPYIDFFNDEVFNVEVFDTINNSKKYMFPDRLHLGSPEGYNVITSYIAAWLEHCLAEDKKS